MRSCFKVAVLFSLGVSLSLVATFAFADGPQSAGNDPVFDRYVDVGLLRTAVETLDASLAADVTLQLAEGERILGRSHKSVSAEEAFGLAIQLATGNRDSETIERLAKSSARIERKEWVQRTERREEVDCW